MHRDSRDQPQLPARRAPVGACKASKCHTCRADHCCFRSRFEAFLPNASFEFAQLSSLPVQSSSVSSKHLRENAEEIQSGYVTLTQIRRLVLLEEADSLVSTLPIVGVWVHLPFSTQSTRNAGALLLHPIIWGACVRFLHTDKVRDRALVDRTTFLLVLLSLFGAVDAK